MLISKTLPNLINGVSQQPDALRYDTQSSAQENTYPSVVEGLTKRLPSEHVAKTNLSSDAKTFVHTINRGTPEQYTVLIRDQSIRVYDLNGNLKTVEVGEGCGSGVDALTYLDTDNADTAIRATTIADVTFIANTETTPTMTGETDASANQHEALVFIQQAADTIYTVEVTQDNGTVTAAFNADSTPTVAEITAGLKALLDNEAASQSFTTPTSQVNWNTSGGSITNKAGQQFEVGTTAKITHISWRTETGISTSSPLYQRNMKWSIYSDDSNSPGTRL